MNPELILSKLSGGQNILPTDKMIWVGKNYSLADLKADLQMVDNYYYNLYKRKPVPVSELPTIEQLFKESFDEFLGEEDMIIVNNIRETAERIRIEKASKSANANALSQMGGEGKC